jgi:hypothetical protein
MDGLVVGGIRQVHFMGRNPHNGTILIMQLFNLEVEAAILTQDVVLELVQIGN